MPRGMTWLMGLIPQTEAMPSTNSKMQSMSLHEQQALDYKFPFCFSFCSITCEKSLNLWLFMTKHIIVCLCPSATAHVAVSHFVLSNQCLWKTAEILLFTWMRKSFQRLPSGNIHNNITTWAGLKSQMLTVPAFGDKETVETSWQMLDLLPPYLFTKQVLHMGLQSQWWFLWLNTLGIRLSPRWKNQSSANAWWPVRPRPAQLVVKSNTQ